MKRLFLVDLLLCLLLLSCTTVDKEKQLLSDVNSMTFRESADYLSYYYTEESGAELSYNYAYYLVQCGDLDKAMYIALNSIDAFPEHLRFRYLKAYIERTQMKLYSYENTLVDILKFNPGDITARDSLLILYMRMRYKDKAIALARDTLKLDSSEKTALAVLAEYIDFYKTVSSDSISFKNRSGMRKKPSLAQYNRTFRKVLEDIERIDIYSI